jgi:predicted amidohydrolase YtcJ
MHVRLFLLMVVVVACSPAIAPTSLPVLAGGTGPQVAVMQSGADLVVLNAAIYTVDADQSWAEALAVREGRLVFVGGRSGVEPWIGPGTRVVDAGGRLILPGFHDTHTHLTHAADLSIWCDLGYPGTLAATQEALVECVRASAGREWVLAFRANDAVFPPEGPPAGFLDAVESERPMLVQQAGQHEVYVNSAALRLTGVEFADPDLDDGIVRDEHGRPTGTFRGAALSIPYEHVPWPSDEELAVRVVDQLAALAPHGIVSVQEITSEINVFATAVAAIPEPAPRVRIAQRVVGYAEQGGVPAERVGAAAAWAREHRTDRFDAGAVKLFVDGTFGAQTAALFEPYQESTHTGWRGEPYFTQDELNDWAAEIDAAGLQLHFHAIGDRGVHMALNAIGHAQRVNGRRDARHQISHLHLTAAEDLPRFRELGVVANVQPFFADNGPYNIDRVRRVLGPERNALMHRFADFLNAGARLVVSTDYPISPLDPWTTIQVALTRQQVGSDAPAFLPEHRLMLADVIAAYTRWGAYANFLDGESGSLEMGKRADFVMLDQNLFAVEPGEIHRTRVLWTIIEGRESYRAERW